MLVYANILRSTSAVASDHAISLLGGAPGPSIVERPEGRLIWPFGEQSAFLDGTAGLEMPNSAMWQSLPDQAFRIYSVPMVRPPAGKNAIIASRDEGKPPFGWSVEDIERNGEVWCGLYVRDRRGLPVWGGSRDGVFRRELGRGDVLILRYANGVASLWANGTQVVAIPLDTDARLNKAPLRIGMYAPGVALWRGYLQAASLRVGKLRENEITRLPAAKSVPVPLPKPPPPGNVITKFRNLGVLSGNDRLLNPDIGGGSHWDLTGTIRETRLANPPKDVTWVGTRNLLRFWDGPAFVDARFTGGALICPDMTPDLNWNPLYQSWLHPRAAIDIEHTIMRRVTFEDLRCHGNGWDVVRLGQGHEGSIENLTFRRFAITMQRDDAFENDSGRDGVLVEDCYVESFVLFSSNNKESSTQHGSKTATLRNNLCYVLPCRVDGVANTIGRYFKLDSKGVRVLILNNIFAVPGGAREIVSNAMFKNLLNNNKMHPDSGGNIICWLGSGSYPFPNPDPSRFTVQIGSTAHNTWNNARAAWWRSFRGHRFPSDPPA